MLECLQAEESIFIKVTVKPNRTLPPDLENGVNSVIHIITTKTSTPQGHFMKEALTFQSIRF